MAALEVEHFLAGLDTDMDRVSASSATEKQGEGIGRAGNSAPVASAS